MELDLTKIQTVAEQAARTVGARIAETLHSGPTSIQKKGRDDFVTEIDLWSEQQIIAAVKGNFPNHIVIGEESQAELVKERGQSLEEISKQGVCWVVDPLDGTANFVSGIPHNCVAIGVLSEGERVFGLVFDPHRDEMFVASKGGGATLNDSAIRVREQTTLLDSVVLTGFPSTRYKNWEVHREVNNTLIDNCHKCRIYGASALEICWVAAGRADVFFQYGLSCWDIAAATCIAEEAGARTGCIRKPGVAYSPFVETTLVTNPKLFDSVFELAATADARARNQE